jgi:hypothetical protein
MSRVDDEEADRIEKVRRSRFGLNPKAAKRYGCQACGAWIGQAHKPGCSTGLAVADYSEEIVEDLAEVVDEIEPQPLSREEIAAWAKEQMGVELEPWQTLWIKAMLDQPQQTIVIAGLRSGRATAVAVAEQLHRRAMKKLVEAQPVATTTSRPCSAMLGHDELNPLPKQRGNPWRDERNPC